MDIITLAGNTTNQVVYNNVSTPPGAPPAGQTLGPITTNASSSVSSVYPGSQPGITTNTTWQTSSTYPGSMPGMSTNYIGFTTVAAYPGSRPMLTTNCQSTTTRVKVKPTTGYCGVAPWAGSGNDNNWWLYYGIASYTYANQFSYSYPTYTYTYSTSTYSYVLYTSTPYYTTNHYDHVHISVF